MIKQASRQSIMTSNIVMVHDDIHIHRILEFVGWEEHTWLVSIHTSYRNKGISTINTKRIHVYHQEESKINISSKQYWSECYECRAPTKALINFAWVDSINSMIWNYEVCSCLRKSRKIKKIGWKSNKTMKVHARRKMAAKDLLKSGFYASRYSKDEFFKAEDV